jgi:hypothetical protein
MGKKPLIGWVGLCGLGLLMTGCNCCNNPAGREKTFASGRADASAGWTNKALNRQPQNVVTSNPAGSTDTISSMSSGSAMGQPNAAGNAGGAWGGSQGMGAMGGMPASNSGGMMSPTGAGTPTSFNSGAPQMNGGMNSAPNAVTPLPAGAMYVGSSRSGSITQTGGPINDTTTQTNAAGSQPVNPAASGVRPAMATSNDMSAVSSLPPPPPTSGAGSSGSWGSSGTTNLPPVPPPPSDPALGNSPPPVNVKSSSSMTGSGVASPGSAASYPDYLNSKSP